MAYYVHRGSGQARVFTLYPRRRVVVLNPSGPTRVFTDHFTDHLFFIFFV